MIVEFGLIDTLITVYTWGEHCNWLFSQNSFPVSTLITIQISESTLSYCLFHYFHYFFLLCQTCLLKIAWYFTITFSVFDTCRKTRDSALMSSMPTVNCYRINWPSSANIKCKSLNPSGGKSKHTPGQLWDCECWLIGTMQLYPFNNG